MKTIKLYTLGCKVNQYDTQAIRERIITSGYREIAANVKTRADVCLINTCTVTHHADADSLNLVRRADKENPGAKIVVTGCLAELDRNKIKAACAKSLIVSNRDKAAIAGILGRVKTGSNDFAISGFSGHTRAFLKIQDGCDNFCSYCKVPLVRGRSKSKPIKQIIGEARRLIHKGFKEIVLTGICLGAYGKDLSPRLSLADVLTELEELTGNFRIRLSSIEAGDISAKLLDIIAGSNVVCPHLHIPLQSGDNKVLKSMNRKYSANRYLKLIKKIKEQIPGASLTTDVLIGFPGEDSRSFGNTMRLVKEIMPLRVHSFPYSPREGTVACRLANAAAAAVVKERMRQMAGIAEKASLAYRSRFIGKQAVVLFEARCKDDPRCWEGYTEHYIKVRLKSGNDLKNRFACVTLKESSADFVYAGKTKPCTKVLTK
ncbi:MAG: tRNA (N(6)-L-threonylcarbamoyladenosine(37)-C(2))-methylthiotransferase MtaB [Candidatus Omnitrophota bacterium]